MHIGYIIKVAVVNLYPLEFEGSSFLFSNSLKLRSLNLFIYLRLRAISTQSITKLLMYMLKSM